MGPVTGKFDADGKPLITELDGQRADRIRTDLDTRDTLHLELTDVVVKEVDDGIRIDRESFDVDETVALDCIRLYESDYDNPGVQLEAFPDELKNRVIERYTRDQPGNDIEWHRWQGTARAIEKSDRTIRLRSGTDGDEIPSTRPDAPEDEMVERTVRLRPEQTEWIDARSLDLSAFLRDKIDDLRES